MKNLIVLLSFLALGSFSFGQVYIDTGHPDIEKKKTESEVRPMDSDLKIQEEEVEESTEKPTETKSTQSTQTSTTKTSSSTTTTTSSSGSQTSGQSDGKVVIDAEMIELEQSLPENAQPGKCYARCYIPNQYRYVEEQVVDKPKSYKEQTIPAVYKTVYDTVLVKEEKRITKEVAAEYEYVKEKIMVSPSTTKWVQGEADANCLSADPKDCQVMCLVETPAEYKTVTRKVVKSPAYSYDEVIPAEYKVVTRKVLEKEETTVKIDVPATYKTVMNKELVKEGGYQDWREVLCQDKLTSDRIRQIQTALKENGYDPGPVDNIFGQQTKDALLQYQIDNELPQGNLNMETLESLGVE